MSGRRRSWRTMSGGWEAISSRALRPSPASKTVYPSLCSVTRTIFRVTGLSSTIRIVGDNIGDLFDQRSVMTKPAFVGLTADGCGAHVIAFRHQKDAHELQVDRVVVDNQKGS